MAEIVVSQPCLQQILNVGLVLQECVNAFSVGRSMTSTGIVIVTGKAVVNPQCRITLELF